MAMATGGGDGLSDLYAELGYNPATRRFGGGLLRAAVEVGRGMTVTDFCKLAGVDEDTFVSTDQGRRRPRPQTVVKILTALARVPLLVRRR